MRQEPRALTSCDVPTGSRADPAVPARRTPATRRPWGRAASLPFRDGSRHTVQTNGSGWLAVERDGKVEKIPIMFFFSKVWVFDKIYRIFWKRYQKRFPDWICKSGPFTQRPGIQRMEKKNFRKTYCEQCSIRTRNHGSVQSWIFSAGLEGFHES